MQIKIEPEDRPLFAVHALRDITSVVHVVLGAIEKLDAEDEWPDAMQDIRVLGKALDLLEALERAVVAARKAEAAP